MMLWACKTKNNCLIIKAESKEEAAAIAKRWGYTPLKMYNLDKALAGSVVMVIINV